MNPFPLVSVMITSYNQRDSLIRAVDSILLQTYRNIQIIIADDHSTLDNSKEIILSYQKKYGKQIKPIFQKKNVGVVKNKNTGFRACEGEYITYLDGDDFYYPEKIERELTLLLKNPTASIAYSNYVFTDLEGNMTKEWATKNEQLPQGDIFFEVYCRKMPSDVTFRCELAHRKVWEFVNFYDENIKAWHDWDARIRMTKKFQAVYSPYIGSAYVDDPNGITKQAKFEFILTELQQVFEKNQTLLTELSLQQQKEIKYAIQRIIARNNILLKPSYLHTILKTLHLVKYPEDIQLFLKRIKNQFKKW